MWKPLRDNGFRRVSVYRIIEEIGITGFLKHCLTTPCLIAVGMDFYMCNRENTVVLPWAALLQGSYCQTLGRLACPFLIFIMIPVYPFEVFGGGRIYRYKKQLWFVLFIITIAECFLVSRRG